MFDLQVKNGLIVNTNGVVAASLYIKDGVVAAISNEEFDAREVLDANGKLLVPI